MEKQIEGIARIICKPTANKGNCERCGFRKQCSKFDDAKALYNEGYHKQSDTAMEIFAEIGKILTAKYNSIQAGCHHRMRFGNADTPQGMKELGELSGVRQVIAEIKAFEKKYMEATDGRN